MNRRYDIDWLRVIAIGLLLVYHTAIGFQPWGGFVGFITNTESWSSLWVPMTLLNVWRIPILFYISGMGLYLAIQNRNWKQLVTERFIRIGIPLIFGSFCIVPLHGYLLQQYYDRDITYIPNMGHLWFLGNILLYVILSYPICFYFKKNNHTGSVLFIKKLLSTPFVLIIFLSLFILEVLIIHPAIFEMYAFTLHGFVLGMISFLLGYLFMVGGDKFWTMLIKWRWLSLLLATLLFFIRWYQSPSTVQACFLSLESNLWIFSILAFGYKHLKKNSQLLTYLKEAAYPVYIMHMVFLFLASSFVFPMKLGVEVKFIWALSITMGGSLFFYEFFIRRISFVRPLFGLKRR